MKYKSIMDLERQQSFRGGSVEAVGNAAKDGISGLEKKLRESLNEREKKRKSKATFSQETTGGTGGGTRFPRPPDPDGSVTRFPRPPDPDGPRFPRPPEV